MILIDMNQVMISNLMMQISADTPLEIDLVRHMVLNSLRLYKKKFSDEYGELVLCYDSKNYWRKKVFPFYKGTRKRDREKSNLNWSNIFEVLNALKEEIAQNLPYSVMEVDGAEADDIISVLCKHQALENIKLQKQSNPTEKVLILSGDKDFIQLQKYPFVSQYNPIQKKYITGIDPKMYILEHVIKGDRSDGIPNFLSDDDTFVSNKRQKPLSKKNISKWVSMDPEYFCNDQQLKFYNRNKTLIDFSYIPIEIEKKILDVYSETSVTPRNKLYKYFLENKLIKLLECIGDF